MTLDAEVRWRRVAALVDGLLEREPEARKGYLTHACAEDDALRTEVEELLSLGTAPSFLDSGALDFAGPLLDIDRGEGAALPRDGRDVTGPLPEHVHTEPGAAFELERELGRGGMATVYLARDAKHGRRVAVKVLSAGLATLVGGEDFVREIRLTARLQHPHVLGLIDSGVFGPDAGALAGRPYYTMPHVEGESLRARLDRGDVLPLGEAVRLLRDMADALCYAHEQGVVHRDIKPENVLLSRGHAVVADFGIAKALFASRTEEGARIAGTGAGGGTLTQLGAIAGTPAYMAPEQAAGRVDIDHRVDLYAWGVVAYELLAGRHPFSDRSSARGLRPARVGEMPRPLQEVAPAVPPDLARLVRRCLAKDPAQRPASAEEILTVLDALGRDAVGFANVPRAVSLLARPQRTRVGAIVAVGVLVVAGAVATYAVRRAEGRGQPREAVDERTVRQATAPRAAHEIVVMGTGDPAVDVPAVQAAVDRGDTVVLEGRFSFDAPPRKPIALTLASQWLPPAAEVLVAKAVVISGVRDAQGEMATIDGGTIPFYVDAPGESVAIRGLRFRRPISRAILVHAVRGLEIATCRIEGVVPFAAVGAGIAIDTHGGIPTPAAPGDPEIVSGRVLIDRNEIDGTGGTARDGTAGILVFSVGRSPDSEVQLDIVGNQITNTSTSTIIVRRIAGRVRVLGNTVRTTREVGVWGNDAVRLVNTGSYLMANNTIECRWANCVGIAVFSQYAEWPIESAVVEDNDVLMSPPPGTVFSDSSAGIAVRGFARGNVVRHNTIRGRARAALSMYVFRGGIPADNEFLDNRFDHFEAERADIFVGSGVLRRRIVGPGTIADRGTAAMIQR